MGVNTSKSISNTLNKIMIELEDTTGGSVTSPCKVTTGNIILQNSNNCFVTNENRCSPNSDAALNAIAKGAAEAWILASDIQKRSLLPGIDINTTLIDVQSIIKSKLEQQCPANFPLTKSLAESDLIFDNCQNANLVNINTGTDVANCAIKTIIHTIIAAQKNIEDVKNNEDVFTFNIAGGIVSASTSIMTCIFVCVLIILFIRYIYQ